MEVEEDKEEEEDEEDNKDINNYKYNSYTPSNTRTTNRIDNNKYMPINK